MHVAQQHSVRRHAKTQRTSSPYHQQKMERSANGNPAEAATSSHVPIHLHETAWRASVQPLTVTSPSPHGLPSRASQPLASQPQQKQQQKQQQQQPRPRKCSHEASAMSSPASRTREHALSACSSNPNIRRSFTLPPRISTRPRASTASIASTSSADGIETLFTHTSAKIVSFTADADADASSTIPWKSVTERTLAVGVLRIYRVISSNVSFLNSGNLLHTIFPKSQCWCVDAESKFVLRIRQDSYYRIELPCESEEDKTKIEEFKTVLAQVLQYERTRCPFTRVFEVELPERPKTPPRSRPKRPPEKAKKWLFDKTWMPETSSRPSTPILEGSDSGTTSSYEEDDRSSIHTDTNDAVPESPETVLDMTPPKPQPTPTPMPSVLERARTFQGLRSVTVPSGMGIAFMTSQDVTVPKAAKTQKEQGQSEETENKRKPSTDAISLLSSADSFYSLETATQGSPSPPYLDAEAELLNPWLEEHGLQKSQEARTRGRHHRQLSEATVRASSSDHIEEPTPVTPTIAHPPPSPTNDIHLSSAPSTPPLISDSEEDNLEPPFLDVPTPPDNIRMKRLTGASQMRAFSPMPQPQNLFFPPAQGPRKQFTAALIRKTYELVLGPPAHLVTLMLRIAAKISNGAFGFNTYRVRHAGEKIPCSWESSDEDDWEEDDYGIPLTNLEGSTLRKRGCSSELD